MSTPLAASVLSKVGDLIDRFGAYAGFAAVIGLALLTLLYIAQARELKRLREWAGQMPERVGDLQGRLGGPPSPAPTAAAVPSPPVVKPPATSPAAPATAAAAAATAVTGGATAPPPPAAAVKPSDSTSLTPGKTGADGARVADSRPTQALPATAPVNPLDRARKPQTARAAGVPANTAGGRPGGPVIAAAIAAVAVLAAVGYLLFGNSGDGGGPKVVTTKTAAGAAKTTTKTTPRPQQPTGAQLNAGTKIFVLNGTTTNGLAERVETRLTGKGFKSLGRDTATDQTRVATMILFAPGKRADAMRVASALGKGADSVQSIDSGSAAQAKRPDGTAPDVVVLVGSDENTPG